MVIRSRRNAFRFHACTMLAIAWLSSAKLTFADPRFPDVFLTQLHTPCAPDCTLCHNNDNGGYQNRRPGAIIGTWTMNYDLNPDDPQSVVDSFMGAEADKLDTDHDGIPDTQELLSGSDPDDPRPGARYKCRNEGAVYGCMHVARRGAVDDVAALASACVAGVGFAILRRRIVRRRGRGRPRR